MRRRVVITGRGLVTPLGHDVAEFGRRMFAAESGVRNIRGELVAQNFPVPYAALIDLESVPRSPSLEAGDTNRFWVMSAAATEAALAQGAPKRIDAVVYGTAEGGTFEVVDESLKLLKHHHGLEGFDWRNARVETSLEFIDKILERKGLPKLPSARLWAINSACASGNQAISVAFERIRAGEWEAALAGGVDARCNPNSLMNFHMLSALTTADVPPPTASRPFDKTRSGFVRGEGAATLLLESLDSALARKAPIYAEVLGSANTSDAYRLTDGREDGASVVHAMKHAILDAGLETSRIDYISAHGTSTPLNDRLETAAIKKVFGDAARKIPASSLKSQIGHSTVAAGAIEAIACTLMLEQQRLAPTINLKERDPDCDLDYVPNESRAARVTTVLSNSFGFGGQNSCLVLRKYDG